MKFETTRKTMTICMLAAAAQLLAGCAHHKTAATADGATPGVDDKAVSAGISPDTKKAFYVTAADAPAGEYNWDSAVAYCHKLGKADQSAWRLPSAGELDLLFRNRATIGGFKADGPFPTGWYWSSSEYGQYAAWVQRFSNGETANYQKTNNLSVRCVR